MNERLITPEKEISFKEFLIANKRNRTILLIAAIALVIQFSVFKYFYPFASFLYGDSFNYLETAFYNLSINKYMVGYPRFLRLFSILTTSDTLLTGFTYLSIQCSALYLLFTLFYFYKPDKIIQTVLLAFTVFSPLFLYLANLISSDGFFLALSLLWFTNLIWLIHKPSTNVIIAHGIVLFVAFTVRYNALVYPFISAFVFWLSGKMSIKTKLVGLGAALFFCSIFVFFISYKHKQISGHWQYSPFSGWQLANNAMYAYRYVDSADRKPVPKRFQALDNMIREYFDSSHDGIKHPQETIQAGTIYMWTPGLPLYNYHDSLFKKNTTITNFQKWSSVSPFFKDYGIYIISKYPWHFIRYFMWPNAQKYYAPPVEFLEVYNTGRDTVPKIAQVWFDYKDAKVFCRTKSKMTNALDFYPILSGLINATMLCLLMCYIILQGWKTNKISHKGILIGVIFWIINAGFTIFASSAALRFQSFPLYLSTVFTILLLEWLWSVAFSREVFNNDLASMTVRT